MFRPHTAGQSDKRSTPHCVRRCASCCTAFNLIWGLLFCLLFRLAGFSADIVMIKDLWRKEMLRFGAPKVHQHARAFRCSKGIKQTPPQVPFPLPLSPFIATRHTHRNIQHPRKEYQTFPPHARSVDGMSRKAFEFDATVNPSQSNCTATPMWHNACSGCMSTRGDYLHTFLIIHGRGDLQRKYCKACYGVRPSPNTNILG